MDNQQVIPPPPPGFKMDAPGGIPPPPPGFKLDSATPTNERLSGNDKVSAQPKSGHPVQDWLGDVEKDLRQGGTRTAPGRVLGEMQGRGSKGYTGLESGVSKGTAEFMGSPELGVVHAAQGVAEIPQHPVKGAAKTVGGVIEAGTIPLSMIDPIEEGMPGAGKTASRYTKAAQTGIEKGVKTAVSAFPTAERAGQMLNDVSKDVGNLPIVLSRSRAELENVRAEIASGGPSTAAITKILKRTKLPSLEDLTKGKVAPSNMSYDEARRFYGNLTKLTVDDRKAIAGTKMGRYIGQLVGALKDDIGDTAAEAGQAAKYYAGMKQYHSAMKMATAAKKIGKLAIGATALGTTYEGGKKVLEAVTGSK